MDAAVLPRKLVAEVGKGSDEVAAVNKELAVVLEMRPSSRRREREQMADKLHAEGRWEEELPIRREVLGLAKLQSTMAMQEDPLVVARAHISIARCYSSLSFYKQAQVHGKKAEQQCETCSGMVGLAELQPLKRAAHLMQAEMFLNGANPQPQAALLHFNQAKDPALQQQDDVLEALLGHCMGLLGEASAQEAQEYQSSLAALQDEAAALQQKLQTLSSNDYQHGPLTKKLDRSRKAAAEVQKELTQACEQAKQQLEEAVDHVFLVISRVEDSLRTAQGGTSHRDNPLVAKLWNRCAEVQHTLSGVKGMMGDAAGQLLALKEIIGAHASGAKIADDSMIKVLKQYAAILVKVGRASDALPVCTQLMELLELQTKGSSTQRSLQAADVKKLLGNVHMALSHFQDAERDYNDALDVYQAHLGLCHPMTLELRERMRNLQIIRTDKS